MGELFADGAYEGNDIFRYLSDNGILPYIKVRKRMLKLDGKKGTSLEIYQLSLRKKIYKSGRIDSVNDWQRWMVETVFSCLKKCLIESMFILLD